ncbi:MAG: NYN domain-containing protein [Snowella sp.]|nr:NYN domain-containing protein [Snowella sp.]
MKTLSLLTSGIILTATGILTGQNMATMLGTAIAASVTTTAISTSEQKKKTNSTLKTLETAIANTETAIQQKIETIEQKVKIATKTTTKVTKEIQVLQTSKRLIISKLQTAQKQQTIFSGKLNDQQQQLTALKTQPPIPQPQKTDKKVLSFLPKQRQTVTHISIDGNNFSKTAEELGLTIDWKALKVALAEQTQGTDTFILKYYTGLYENPTYEQRSKLNYLKSLKYEVISLPLSRQGNGKWKTIGDDMAIGVDLMDSVQPGDQVILVTGDGDFFPLIQRLLDRRANVTVIGASSHTHYRLQALQQEGFQFIRLESISEQISQLQKLAVA